MLPAGTVVGWLLGSALDRWLHTSWIYRGRTFSGNRRGFHRTHSHRAARHEVANKLRDRGKFHSQLNAAPVLQISAHVSWRMPSISPIRSPPQTRNAETQNSGALERSAASGALDRIRIHVALASFVAAAWWRFGMRSAVGPGCGMRDRLPEFLLAEERRLRSRRSRDRHRQTAIRKGNRRAFPATLCVVGSRRVCYIN